jgi:hypothetical protein
MDGAGFRALGHRTMPDDAPQRTLRTPADLVAALQADAPGTVKDFKLTDGKGIGVVVELSGGTTTWFFDDEITSA